MIQNLEKLLLGRISAVIDDHQVLKYTTRLHNLPKVFKISGCLQGINVQIGFSPNKSQSKEYAKKISEAINELRESGKLKEILKSYGLSDWK